MASRIVGGDNDTAFVIDLTPAARPVGTSGSAPAMSKGAPITGIESLVDGDDDLVGRHVTLKGLRVGEMAKDGGFYVRSGDSRVFVLPADKDKVSLREGDTVSVDGVVMELPSGMRERLTAGKDTNDDIYIFATQVNK